MGDASEGAVDLHGGDTVLAMAVHLTAMATWVVGPLLILGKTDDAFVDRNARNAINWQLTFTAAVPVFFAVGVLVQLWITILLLIGWVSVGLCCCLVAAVRASRGVTWSYPLAIRVL